MVCRTFQSKKRKESQAAQLLNLVAELFLRSKMYLHALSDTPLFLFETFSIHIKK